MDRLGRAYTRSSSFRLDVAVSTSSSDPPASDPDRPQLDLSPSLEDRVQGATSAHSRTTGHTGPATSHPRVILLDHYLLWAGDGITHCEMQFRTKSKLGLFNRDRFSRSRTGGGNGTDAYWIGEARRKMLARRRPCSHPVRAIDSISSYRSIRYCCELFR
jgi:hypothetical protein